MSHFDASSLREFSYKTSDEEIAFSKNEITFSHLDNHTIDNNQTVEQETSVIEETSQEIEIEGELVESPLVGVAYLSPGPDKDIFVSVGDTVKKGQTLLIIEAMKVMNEIPAPRDGIVTEVLVNNEEVVEFGKGLVRIK